MVFVGKIIVSASILLSTFVVLYFLIDDLFLPLVVAFTILALLDVWRIFVDGYLPPSIGDTSYFFGVAIQLLPIPLFIPLYLMRGDDISYFSSVAGHPLALQMTLIGLQPNFLILSLLVAVFGLIARWSRNEPPATSKLRNFFRGGAISFLAAIVISAPEYVWVKYHENKLATGQTQEVIASLHSLSRYPFGSNRFKMTACKRLILRDIDDEYFMYEGTSFLPDKGYSKVEDHLRARFGTEMPEIIEVAKKEFGDRIVRECTDAKNPSN